MIAGRPDQFQWELSKISPDIHLQRNRCGSAGLQVCNRGMQIAKETRTNGYHARVLAPFALGLGSRYQIYL